MGFEAITYDVDGKVVRIGLNRPKTMNAIDGAMKRELLEAVKMAAEVKDATVVLIYGHGKAFSTGVDLKDAAFNSWEHSPEGWTGHFNQMIDTARVIWKMDIPVITAVKGYCLGAGCDLALMGDLTLASDDAKFGEPEVRHGAFAPTLIVPWVVGMKKAKEFLIMGKTIGADEAKAIGMVNEVFPLAEFDQNVESWLEYICKLPKPALKVCKRAINKGYEMMGLFDAIEYNREISALLALYKSKEERESRNQFVREHGLKAFLEQRDKKFE